jgi:uncharacterized 2Fe-2S/4Fe-4S cluster protein (DUF4445 family)
MNSSPLSSPGPRGWTLLSREAWKCAQEIASSITSLELTVEPRYFEEYTAALFLPYTDPSLFPSAT